MIERMVVCDIGIIWDGIYRFKVYTDDDNVLKMATAIEIYI